MTVTAHLVDIAARAEHQLLLDLTAQSIIPAEAWLSGTLVDYDHLPADYRKHVEEVIAGCLEAIFAAGLNGSVEDAVEAGARAAHEGMLAKKAAGVLPPQTWGQGTSVPYDKLPEQARENHRYAVRAMVDALAAVLPNPARAVQVPA